MFSIALIGAGNIGQALLECTCGSATNVARPCHADEIIVFENDTARIPGLKDFVARADKPVTLETQVGPTLQRAGAVIIAVKPQDFTAVARELTPILEPSQLVISLMAGVSITTISRSLNGHSAVVRSMPNLPARIGRAITVYYFAPGISSEHRELAEHLLATIGDTLVVESEDLLDPATAISGSGPGYLYYLAHHMVEEAVLQGFTREQAAKLVASTWGGAVELWLNSGQDPAQLLSAVTSKGGTTAAAVSIFEQLGVGNGLRSGVARACARAKELGS